jgi:GTP-binding protein HflX
LTTTASVIIERPTRERAMLVGIQQPADRMASRDSLEELERLAETAGADVVKAEQVTVRKCDPGYFISRSKMEQFAASEEITATDCVIFDAGLSPTQQRNLEEGLKRKVLDRQQLILDIFATRARTSEGKVQVELAQLKYLLPRLRGMWKHLERQAGGIGTRGPGEKQIESDRRKIIGRIAHLEDQIRRIRTTRDVQRRRRQRNHVPNVSIVGYTNAGKSTLLNALTRATVLAEDKLFATLDPTTRALRLPEGTVCTLTDTVGFITRLPTTLAAAFRATLEEISHSDLIVQVVDANSANLERDLKTTAEVLESLGLQNRRILTVWNKIDQIADPVVYRSMEMQRQPSIAVSALTGQGLSDLAALIEHHLDTRAHALKIVLKPDEYHLLARLHADARVDHVEYGEEGMLVTAAMPAWLAHEFRHYVLGPPPGNEVSG